MEKSKTKCKRYTIKYDLQKEEGGDMDRGDSGPAAVAINGCSDDLAYICSLCGASSATNMLLSNHIVDTDQNLN